MDIPQNLLNLGFTKYEAQVYLSLISKHPLNGSQLSRLSGVPRANIYNTLDGLKARDIVMEVGKGLYAAIPVQELTRRLRIERDQDLSVLRDMAQKVKAQTNQEYVWTLTGNSQVMAKVREMIERATCELFIRFFPEEGEQLESELKEAERRGVTIKYVSLGPPPLEFDYQVVHYEHKSLTKMIGGRSLEMVADQREVITGCLREGADEETVAAWTQNQWLTFSIRDAIRHDFYHVYLYKVHELGEQLSEREKELYRLIKKDYWRFNKTS